MTESTDLILTARRAERCALDGDGEGFLAECLALNDLVRKVREGGADLSGEETIALTDVAAASMVQDVARQIESAARGLLALQQPIGASRLLVGALNDPLVGEVRCLKDLHAKVRAGLAHAETFEAFRTRHLSVEAEPVDLEAPRVQAELAAVRRFMELAAPRLAGKPVRILSIGAGRALQEGVLAGELPDRADFTFVELGPVEPAVGIAGLPGPSRPFWSEFIPASWFDLPKREGGYDLVLCLNVLQQQPNLEGFVAFLHEQCGAGIYSVPEVLKHYSPVTTVDAPVYLNLHGFNEAGLVRLFDRVGLEGMRTERTADGFVIGTVGFDEEVA